MIFTMVAVYAASTYVRHKDPPAPLAERSTTSGEFEFKENDNALFKRVASLMRQVAALFTLHAVIIAADNVNKVRIEGLGAFPGFFDSADELAYAYFIRSAAGSFDTIADTAGNDIANLLVALNGLEGLWKKMRVPLTIKSVIIGLGVFKSMLS